MPTGLVSCRLWEQPPGAGEGQPCPAPHTPGSWRAVTWVEPPGAQAEGSQVMQEPLPRHAPSGPGCFRAIQLRPLHLPASGPGAAAPPGRGGGGWGGPGTAAGGAAAAEPAGGAGPEGQAPGRHPEAAAGQQRGRGPPGSPGWSPPQGPQPGAGAGPGQGCPAGRRGPADSAVLHAPWQPGAAGTEPGRLPRERSVSPPQPPCRIHIAWGLHQGPGRGAGAAREREGHPTAPPSPHDPLQMPAARRLAPGGLSHSLETAAPGSQT